MGGVHFFEVSHYRKLRPTSIQKYVEKLLILRSQIVENRNNFAFSFRVRFEVDFSTIFDGFWGPTWAALQPQDGSMLGPIGVR